MTEASKKRLIIDLAACDACAECSAGDRILILRERATFELVCRRCAHASCILACPFDARERAGDGAVIKRHNLRCVSCKSCALACPFGTIYTELLPFYTGGESVAGDRLPQLCKNGALEFREVESDEPGVHIIDEFLAARVRAWRKDDTSMEATA